MIVFGMRTFGRVDATEEGLRVVTRFFHISFVPLVPLGSFVLLPGSDAGVAIPLSGKSVLFAYLRGALFVGALFSVVDLLATHGETTVPIVALVFAAALFAGSYPLSKASKARREELLRFLA